MARRLVLGRVDQSQRCAVEEEANRHAGFTEQALQARVWTGAPAVGGVGLGVEVWRWGGLDEDEPIVSPGLKTRGSIWRGHSPGRSEVIFILGQRNREAVGRLGEDFSGPFEDFGEEPDGVGYRLVAVVSGQCGQPSLHLDRPMPVHEHPLSDQHRWRHDQPDRANLAEPFAMGEEFGRGGSQGCNRLPWLGPRSERTVNMAMLINVAVLTVLARSSCLSGRV